jgi:RNA polymerase sigma-70 factor (ECF subfamily)
MNMKGYKYKEIAEKMNLPIGTVKSRIFLTRRKIAERFKDYSN